MVHNLHIANKKVATLLRIAKFVLSLHPQNVKTLDP